MTLLCSAGAAVSWWVRSEPRVPPLEPGWAATVLAIGGDGIAGFRDGDRGRARFSDPFGVAVDVDGMVYVADAGDAQRIRGLAPDGRVFTIAGGTLGFADGVGAAARFNTPSGLAIDAAGVLYLADTGNNAIRRITKDGRVSTLAGDGIAGDRDGPGHLARFNGPIGVAIDAAGRVIVADTYNDRIRAIGRDGIVSTLAGSTEPGLVDGTAMSARFHTPCGLAVDGAGRTYVADTGNGVVRVIDRTGTVTTTVAPHGDGPWRPVGIAAGPGGDIYVTDERGRIFEISAGGGRALAGSIPGFRDGAGSEARFRRPTGIAAASPGRLFVADTGNALLRLVVARSRLEHRPPPSPRIAPRFDDEAFGWRPLLWPVSPIDGPHEIAGTIGEARGSEAERFHAGIDVRAEEGTEVRAVRDGVVESPIAAEDFGGLSERIRVGPISYVHVRTGRTRVGETLDASRFIPSYDAEGTLAGIRVKRGARFTTGEVIATVNSFNHVHLNVGWPGEEHNPLRFRLAQFEDTVPPTIARGGVRVYDENGQLFARRARGRLIVSGRVEVVVDAWDQIDGNRPGRRLGMYALGYQVLLRNGSPAPGFIHARQTIAFDRLAPEPDATRLVYARGSGIPFYGRRRTRFLYIVTNTFREAVASAGIWDTTLLPPGEYILRIRASDISGNEAVINRDLPITVVSPDLK